MNKVITINLNGRAYQLEEAGYEALRNYLDQAAAKLRENPDKDEIMADFESAIAEKCDARLGARKNVVSAAEIEEIIKGMGPVEAGSHEEKNEGAATPGGASSGAPKKLYRIRQGEWVAGVSNGLAAYFGVDVTVVRVGFVLLTLITHFFWVAAYLILWIVMPVARTDEELASARGTKPFNAHDFIEQAKARAEEFRKEFGSGPVRPPKPPHNATREEWDHWRDEMKQWKDELKAWHRTHRDEMRAWHRQWHDERREAVRARHERWNGDRGDWADAGVGFFRFIMGLIIAALFVFFVLAIITLVKFGTILGIATVGAAALGLHPLWVSVVFLVALFYVVMLPFKLLMKNARPWHWGHYSFFNDLMQSIFFVFALYLLIWSARELFPVVNGAYLMAITWLQSVRI